MITSGGSARGQPWRRSAGATDDGARRPSHQFYRERRGASRGQAVVLNTPQGRRIVGFIVDGGDGKAFVKRVETSKHLHRQLNAWGIDVSLFESLPASGVKTIVIESDTGSVETASVETFRRHGVRFDFGHGPQIFLPRRYFARRDRAQRRLDL